MDVFTLKGKECILYKNNKYSLSNKGKDKISWRCTIRGCNATIYTNDQHEIKSEKNNHHHIDKVNNVGVAVLKAKCKRKAMDNFDDRPSKILRTELSSLQSTENVVEKDLKNCKLALYRCRRKQFPKLPKSMSECIECIRDVPLATSRREDFLLHAEMTTADKGIVIFTSPSNLRHLSRAKLILGDGTFYVVPKQFHQLYTLHGCFNGHYVPLVFGLLPDKSETSYTQFLDAVVSQCSAMGLTLNVQTVLLDFEKATHNAFQTIFPLAEVKCCRFHFGQAVFRKIKQIGLQPTYINNEDETGHWLKSFFGLPFLDPEDVLDAFTDDLMPDEDPRVEAFADYMLHTYISPTALYPPYLWATGTDSDALPRTTNAAESFHRHLKQSVGHSHPNIFLLSRVLLNLQEENYIKLQSINTQRRVPREQSDKLDFIKTTRAEFARGDLNRLQFVRKMAYKFLPVTTD